MNREEELKRNIQKDIEVPDVVKAKAKEAFAIIEKKPRKNKKKFTRLAAAAAAVVIMATAGLHPSVQASIKSISYDIAKNLGIKKDLSPYKTVIDQSVSDGNVTITLNEVILDENELIVSTTETYSEKNDGESSSEYSAQVTVNGKNRAVSAAGMAEKIDPHTVKSIMTYQLEEVEVDNEWDVEIAFVRDGSWLNFGNMKLTFKTSGIELMKNTKKVSIDEQIVLPNGTTVTAYEFTQNTLGEKIYIKTNETTKRDYDIKLIGTDDLGNEVEYYMSSANGDTIIMKTDLSTDNRISESAKSITLTPYAAKFPEKSGKMNDDFQVIGDSFTITLN